MDSENLRQLKQGSIPRLLWQYAAPAVTGMVVTSLYNIIDRIYIGQGVGPEAIAGLGITFPVMNLSAAMGVLIGAGAAARTSIMLGANDNDGAGKVLGTSLVLTLVIATIYTSLFGIFIDDILMAFGASEVTLPYARDFMMWMLPGMLLTNLCFNLNNIIRASGYPMRAMMTMVIGAGCNIIIDPIFIFTFDMGIQGAAIATDISMLISTVFVVAHFMRRDSVVRFRPGIYGIDWRVIYGIMSIGAAPSLVNAAACVINITINNSLRTYGNDLYIGAASIFITYTSLLVTFVLGIGLGMQPIVGYNYGAGDTQRVRRAYWLATGIATAISTAGCVIGMLWPSVIARMFTSDAELTEVTSQGIHTALWAFWMVGFQSISTGFFQSIGKAGKSIIMSLLRQVIFMYPLLMILPERIGLKGVWMSFPVSDVLATIVTIALIAWQLRHLDRMTGQTGLTCPTGPDPQ